MGKAGKKITSGLTRVASQTPFIGEFVDDTGDKAASEMRDMRRTYDAIGLPSTKWEDFRPDLFTPEMAQYALTSEDPLLRSAQMNALEKMSALSSEGFGAEDEYAFGRARDLAGNIARSGNQAAIADAERRGVSGGGMEFAMREAANQQAAERAQEAGMARAAEAAKARRDALVAYSQGLSGMRSQDYQVNSGNTDIINEFNQRNTATRNAASEANVNTRNQAQQFNQQGRRDLDQQRFDNQITRAGGQAQARQGMANVYAAQNAANADARNKKMEAGTKIVTSRMGGGKMGG